VKEVKPMREITKVEVVSGFTVRLTFDDGFVRTVDLRPFLRGPMFAELREDPDLFAQVFVDEELGTIAWPNGPDLDADVLHGDEVPAWAATAR
jgi:hypothetical protein